MNKMVYCLIITLPIVSATVLPLERSKQLNPKDSRPQRQLSLAEELKMERQRKVWEKFLVYGLGAGLSAVSTYINVCEERPALSVSSAAYGMYCLGKCSKSLVDFCRITREKIE